MISAARIQHDGGRAKVRRSMILGKAGRNRGTTIHHGYSITGAIRELVLGVEWTPAFIAFLYYIAVVITNRISGADVAIVASLVFVLLRIGQLRVGRALVFFGLLTFWGWISYLVGGQNPEVYTGTWELTKIWLVAFVGFNSVRTRSQIRFFLAFAVSCFVLYPVRGALLNYFVAGYTVFGRAIWNYAYANPNDLAAFSIVFAAMAVALAYMSLNKLVRAASILAAGSILVLIILTQSRGAIIAIAVVSVWVMIRKLRSFRSVMIAGAVLAAAMLIAPDSVWKRLGGLANVSISSEMQGVDEERSAEQRWQLAQIAVRIARDNMVFGVGAGAYSIAHGEYAATVTSEFSLGGGNRDAHNTYLRTAAELGLVGLLLLLLELSAALFIGWRATSTPAPSNRLGLDALKAGLVAYMLAGIFGSFAYIVMLHLLIVTIESLAALEPGRMALARPTVRLRGRMRSPD